LDRTFIRDSGLLIGRSNPRILTAQIFDLTLAFQ
jgi:hypothetical protein